ncbi:MAG: M20/M25/M40 family metallo-hydrolase [Methanobacteriota archaeon]
MDELRLLLDLVEVPSPSGDEGAACDVFAARAARLGFRTERDAVGNVLATIGSVGPHTMFLGHIDTTPGFWPVRFESGSLSGRGVVDAKGALAAGLLAAARLGPDGPGTRTVVAAVGEETDSRGALHLLRGDPPDALLVGEPSGWNRVAVGYRGRRAGRFHTTSVPSHASSPTPGALDCAVAAAARVQSFVAARARSRPFDSPTARLVRWAHEARVDEESASFEVDVRASNGFDWAALAEASPDLRWSPPVDGVLVEKGNRAVRALVGGIRDRGGRPGYLLKAGTSDMNLAARVWDVPMASYGPGDPTLDHGPLERLAIVEFLRSVDVLESAFRRLASPSTRPKSGGIA